MSEGEGTEDFIISLTPVGEDGKPVWKELFWFNASKKGCRADSFRDAQVFTSRNGRGTPEDWFSLLSSDFPDHVFNHARRNGNGTYGYCNEDGGDCPRRHD